MKKNVVKYQVRYSFLVLIVTFVMISSELIQLATTKSIHIPVLLFFIFVLLDMMLCRFCCHFIPSCHYLNYRYTLASDFKNLRRKYGFLLDVFIFFCYFFIFGKSYNLPHLLINCCIGCICSLFYSLNASIQTILN